MEVECTAIQGFSIGESALANDEAGRGGTSWSILNGKRSSIDGICISKAFLLDENAVGGIRLCDKEEDRGILQGEETLVGVARYHHIYRTWHHEVGRSLVCKEVSERISL